MPGHSHFPPPNVARNSDFCADRSAVSSDLVIGGKDEQKQRPITLQRHAAKHASRLAVDHINTVIARTITMDLERRD